MTYFAVLDENDIVTGVYASSNDQITDDSGLDNIQFEKSSIGEVFGISDMSKIVETSKDRNFRGAFAGVGLLYDRERDVFLIPKRFPSWIYDEARKSWVPPQEFPNDGGDYSWDESNLKWIPIGNSDDGATLFDL